MGQQAPSSSSNSTCPAKPRTSKVVNTVDGVAVGCFPDLYTALAGNPPDQVITLQVGIG